MNQDHEPEEAPKQLFTAADAARFCQVDLKTIHNWSDRGELRHFRTPGRHLRFHRSDLLDFLRRYGYPVPEELKQARPRVFILDASSQELAALRKALAKRFDVTTFVEPFEALIALGRARPDALILDVAETRIDGFRIVERLRALSPTEHIRAVAYSTREDLRRHASEAGAYAFVTKGDPGSLRRTLTRLLGLEQG